MLNKKVKEMLEELNEDDIYSELSQAMYKLSENPSYLVLSRLVYLLDNKSFLNLIKYFGGKTITLPTLSQYKILTKAFILFIYTTDKEIPINDAKALITNSDSEWAEILKVYKSVAEVLIGNDNSW